MAYENALFITARQRAKVRRNAELATAFEDLVKQGASYYRALTLLSEKYDLCISQVRNILIKEGVYDTQGTQPSDVE